MIHIVVIVVIIAIVVPTRFPIASATHPRLGSHFLGRKMDVQTLRIIHHALKAEVTQEMNAGKTCLLYGDAFCTQWKKTKNKNKKQEGFKMSVEVVGSGIGLGSPTLKSQKVLTLPQGCPVSFRESQFEMCLCSLVEGLQSRLFITN